MMLDFLDRYRRPLLTAGEAGAGGGGAGATPPGAGAGAAAAGDAPPAADGKGADGPWYKSFNLAKEDADYIEGKGAKDLPTLLKTTRDFEGVARNRNVLPKPDPAKLKDWEGWSELGWEKDAAKYILKAPEAGKFPKIVERDNALWDTVQKVAHENRVPLPALQAMHDGVMEHWHKQIEAIERKGVKEMADLQAALKTEWGGDYDAKTEQSKRAARSLFAEVGVDDFKALEEAVGAVKLTKVFAKLGAAMGEDVLKGGDAASRRTPEAARSERLRLEADKDWMKVFNDARDPRQKEYVAQRQALIAVEAKGSRAA